MFCKNIDFKDFLWYNYISTDEKMALLTAEQILHEIESLPPHEKDNLELLLNKKVQEELLNRMALDRSLYIKEKELFE